MTVLNLDLQVKASLYELNHTYFKLKYAVYASTNSNNNDERSLVIMSHGCQSTSKALDTDSYFYYVSNKYSPRLGYTVKYGENLNRPNDNNPYKKNWISKSLMKLQYSNKLKVPALPLQYIGVHTLVDTLKDCEQSIKDALKYADVLIPYDLEFSKAAKKKNAAESEANIRTVSVEEDYKSALQKNTDPSAENFNDETIIIVGNDTESTAYWKDQNGKVDKKTMRNLNLNNLKTSNGRNFSVPNVRRSYNIPIRKITKKTPINFTKVMPGGCDLCLMSEIDKSKLKQNKLYLIIKDNQIKYRTTLTPASDYITLEGDISKINGELYNAISKKDLKNVSSSCKEAVLSITLKRGHIPLGDIDILRKTPTFSKDIRVNLGMIRLSLLYKDITAKRRFQHNNIRDFHNILLVMCRTPCIENCDALLSTTKVDFPFDVFSYRE